ncbi:MULTISPECIES: hypothetical protein [Pseudomonas]|nr:MULTISPECIES: hypothetical protein [Pseudomonas]UUT19757.1 hypothetical protein NRG23_18720 [Pseudomonas sp. T8]WDG48481.1 hypothetical protein PUP58_01510 [Pseudomonas chlororaphis]WJV22913.1 hypothetical protein PSR66_25270 [Pseudomonas chlororaphis]
MKIFLVCFQLIVFIEFISIQKTGMQAATVRSDSAEQAASAATSA